MAIVTVAQGIGFDVNNFWTANTTGASEIAFEDQVSATGNPLLGHEERVYSTVAFTNGTTRYNYGGTWNYIADRGLVTGSGSISGSYDSVSLEDANGAALAGLTGVSFAVDLGDIQDTSLLNLVVNTLLQQALGPDASTPTANIHTDATPNLAALAFNGADTMTGNAGNDVLRGYAGNDVLNGLGGNDTLVGGTGNDRFIYGLNGGADVIQDFQAGAASGDTIDLTAFSSLHTLNDILAISAQVGGNTVINFGGGNTLTLAGVNKLYLTAGDFVGVTAGAVLPIDVIWNDTTTGRLRGWQLESGALAGNLDLGSRPAGWQIAAMDDFNNDGSTDLIWRNSSTGELREWLMSNSSITSNLTIGTLSPAYQIAATGDFNGDGSADILLRSNATNDLRIWHMAGGQIVNVSLLPNPTSQWKVAGVGDFNGDGSSDLLWRNIQTGELRDWNILNGGLAANKSFGNVPLAYEVAAIGDYNGDGTSDILWKNSSTAEVREWLMSNNSILENYILGRALAYQVVGAGDYNQDGTDDVLFRNDTTGELREWLLANGRVASNIILGGVSPDWDPAVHPATHSGEGLLLV